MTPSGPRAYRAEKILSADPMELIRMLYGAAIESVDAARHHLAERDIASRSASISKAVEIVTELVASLQPERAPEVSRSLSELYDYMQRRLLHANFEQNDAPLAEVGELLATLAEAWQAVSLPPPAENPGAREGPAPSWNPPCPEPALEGALHGWRF